MNPAVEHPVQGDDARERRTAGPRDRIYPACACPGTLWVLSRSCRSPESPTIFRCALRTAVSQHKLEAACYGLKGMQALSFGVPSREGSTLSRARSSGDAPMCRSSKIARSAPPESPIAFCHDPAGGASSDSSTPASGSPSHPTPPLPAQTSWRRGGPRRPATDTSPSARHWSAASRSPRPTAPWPRPTRAAPPRHIPAMVFIAFILCGSVCGNPAATLFRA